MLIGNNRAGKTIATGTLARGFDEAGPRAFKPRNVRVYSRGSLREPTPQIPLAAEDAKTSNQPQAFDRGAINDNPEPQYPVSVRATARIGNEVLDWIRVLEQVGGQDVERDEMVAWSKAQRLQRQVRNGESVTLPGQELSAGSNLGTDGTQGTNEGVGWDKLVQSAGPPDADTMPNVESHRPSDGGPARLSAAGPTLQAVDQNTVRLVSVDWNIRQDLPEAVFSDC